MHFEILVEDQSGKKMLDCLIPKILGINDTFTVHSYKGIGRIPKNMNHKADPSKRILLDRLPKLLTGYGRTFSNYPAGFGAAVVIVCDLDSRCLKEFRDELLQIAGNCSPSPLTAFCIAIEEAEAWFLGDVAAIKSAYSSVVDSVLTTYVQDSICGTWEILADAIHKGGRVALQSGGYQEIGKQKNLWAEKITPNMTVDVNRSPSFQYFVRKVKDLATMAN